MTKLTRLIVVGMMMMGSGCIGDNSTGWIIVEGKNVEKGSVEYTMHPISRSGSDADTKFFDKPNKYRIGDTVWISKIKQ